MTNQPRLIRGPPRQLRLCIFPNCKEHLQPGNWMCRKHWSWVPAPERRALMTEATRLRGLGQRKPSAELIELVGLARRAAQMTEAKSEIAAKISDALDRPLVSAEAKADLFREVEQDPEPAAPKRGSFAVHKKPGTFDDCEHLAELACNKCGWVRA